MFTDDNPTETVDYSQNRLCYQWYDEYTVYSNIYTHDEYTVYSNIYTHASQATINDMGKCMARIRLRW